MDIKELKSFLVIAEEGSFRRAAERLAIAQPPLSRRVKAIEQSLGVQLFVRGSSGVSLTAAGERLLDLATSAITHFDSIDSEMRAFAAGFHTRIKIAYTSNLGYGFIGHVLSRFRDLYPEVRVDPQEESYAAQLKLLREGQLDIGLLTLPIHEPAMIVRRLHREPLKAVLPKGHTLAKRKRVVLNELAKEPFLLCPRYEAKGFHEHLLELFHAAGFVPHIIQEIEQKHTIERMIASGMGVSILPASAIAEPLPGVVYRGLTPALPAIHNAAVWHEHRPPKGVLRHFVDLVKSESQSYK